MSSSGKWLDSKAATACLVLVVIVGVTYVVGMGIAITYKFLDNLERDTAAKERAHAMICVSALKACQMALEYRVGDIDQVNPNGHIKEYNDCVDKVLTDICVSKERVDEIMDSIAADLND